MERIEDCISFMIGKVGQQVTRRARELLAPYGVTPVQYAVLKVLTDHNGINGADLGARMVLDSASITGVIDRMESVGLVTRRADSEDRRVQRIYTTEKGQALQGPIDDAMDSLNSEAFAILGGPDPDLPRRLRLLGDPKNWRRGV